MALSTILVTGGAGFIGANYVLHMLTQHPQCTLINLDKLTYAGSKDNLDTAFNNPRHVFVEGDIGDSTLLETLFRQYQPQAVVHLAAESHVDRSIAGPAPFITTNIVGTFTLLEACRQFTPQARFHHISTDEVFGSLGDEGLFSEISPYQPNSPYSASKASSDMLVRSYHHTYGLDTVITNCSNNYGARQHREKLIPTLITHALAGKPLPVYGDGLNIRDWLHVQDHVEALECVLLNGISGETYAIGSNNEWRNLDLVHLLCDLLDTDYPRKDKQSYRQQLTFVQDRPGHDRRYAIDSRKITSQLGWQARIAFRDGLQETIRWYVNRYNLRPAMAA